LSAPKNPTELLAELTDGDDQSLNALLPIVYDELRRLAGRYLRRERPNHTLQPTALVNEACLRLIDQSNLSWENRAHFFGIAANLMRQILVEHARRRNALKRRSSAVKLTSSAADFLKKDEVDLVALDDALNELAAIDPEKSRVVELRYFGGLTVEETAEVLKTSRATVIRHWRLARAWLYNRLTRGKSRS
jgi:RNA polymerase sigma factor (TIGR02999 family)